MTGPTVYNVRLNSVDASKRIRDLFSGFFQRGVAASLPSSLKGISIRNKVTHETRIRIAILRQLGINYKERNPGGNYQVKGFESRPVLVINPPSSATGPRSRSYNFIEAVTNLPCELSDANLVHIHQVINTRNPGKLQSLFVVLQDDDRARIDLLVQQHRDRDRGSRPAKVSNPVTSSGAFKGPGSGMDLQSALRLPPPPPPTCQSENILAILVSKCLF